MAPLLKILAVDDHHIFLHGLSECLKSIPFIEKVDTCSSYGDLMRKLSEYQPHVIFLDLNMGKDDGFIICREITQMHKNIFVAVLTQYDSEKFVERAYQCGAGAYFIKNTEPDVLAEFLNRLRNGKIKEFYVHIPQLAETKNDSFGKDDYLLIERLSLRERQVLQLIAKGIEHESIEKTLNITYDTLKTHRAHILQKLQLKNVRELVTFAIKNSLLDREAPPLSFLKNN